MTREVGFPITVDWEGGFHFRLVSPSDRAKRQTVELVNFRARVTFTNAVGESVKEGFAGVNRIFIEDGQLFVAINGLDVGAAGQLVINLETGQVVKFVGHDRGGVEAVCEALS